MVLHLLVDVQVSRRRSIESGKEFVHDDQQFHLTRTVDEGFLDLFLELLHLLHGGVFWLIEPVGQHLAVDAVLPEFLGVSLACFFVFDVSLRRFIRGDDRTLISKVRFGKQLIVLAGLIDAGRNEQRVAVSALQSITRLHIHQNIGDDLLQPILTTQDLLHRAPTLFQLSLGQIRQSPCPGLEPFVDFCLRRDQLVDVAGFVAKVEHDAILHRFVELVRMNVSTEHFDTTGLVFLQKWRAGETDEHGTGQDRLHGIVQVT